MFLVRAAFWLSLVILFLPAEPASDTVHAVADSNATLTGGALVDAARMTVDDVSGICARQPGVCETGSAALDVFVRKAQYGAKLVIRAVTGEEAPAEATEEPLVRRAKQDKQSERAPVREAAAPAGTHKASAKEDAPRAAPMSQNTLRPEDTEPRWRDPRDNKRA